MVNIVFLSVAILGYVVMGIIMFLLFWLDKDGIISAVKVKFGKGYIYTLMFGSDKRLYLGAKQFARKSHDTTTTEIDGMPYVMNKKKLRQYNGQPALIFEEGISDPLEIESGNVKSDGLTPELFKQAIIVARQSGKMPQAENLQKWQFYLTIGACAGSFICAYMVYQLQGSLDGLTPIMQGIADALNKVLGAVVK